MGVWVVLNFFWFEELGLRKIFWFIGFLVFFILVIVLGEIEDGWVIWG